MLRTAVLLISLISHAGVNAFQSSACSPSTLSPARGPLHSTIHPHALRRPHSPPHSPLFSTPDDSQNPKDPYSNFPPLLKPVAQAIDSTTGGWALSYADCSPETESTPLGTNVAKSLISSLGTR